MDEPVKPGRDAKLSQEIARLSHDLQMCQMQNKTLRRSQEALKMLRELTLTLNSTRDLDRVTEYILDGAGEIAPCDAASVLLLEDETLRLAGHSGYDLLDMPGGMLADFPVFQRMHETGEPVVIEDGGALPGFGVPPHRVFAGIPLGLRDEVIGFLNLYSNEPGCFTPARIETLQAFADHAALALENALLYAHLQELTTLKERQRLARDLHDAVSQTLFSASMITQALPVLWEKQPDKARKRLAQLDKLTRGAMAEMRSLLLELRPDDLKRAGIEALLKQLAHAVMGRTEMAVTVDIDCSVALPEKVRIALYYIAQEALNNVVKHSRATKVSVSLYCRPGKPLRLYIGDNGRGFAFEEVGSTALGLAIMRERAASFGGHLEITSEEGEGTLVVVSYAMGETQ